MAFGIGTNTNTPNAGEVQGSQWEVACDCWFTAEGGLLPRLELDGVTVRR